jgi:hypothetical protein
MSYQLQGLICWQVMAIGLSLIDTKDGTNVYKLDAKKRINSISRIDKILKVGKNRAHGYGLEKKSFGFSWRFWFHYLHL